jgi:hypothetical protein
MKVLIEVKECDKCFKFSSRSGHDVWFAKDEVEYPKDCEPVQEGWITEDEATEIFHSLDEVEIVKGNVYFFIKRLKELGRIKQSKTAKEKFEELAIKPILIEGGVIDSVTKYIQEIVDAAKDAISEAEKK